MDLAGICMQYSGQAGTVPGPAFLLGLHSPSAAFHGELHRSAVENAGNQARLLRRSPVTANNPLPSSHTAPGTGTVDEEA